MKVGEAWQGRGKVLRVSAPPRASGQMAEKQKGGARSPPAKGRQIKWTGYRSRSTNRRLY
ncbi:hypothetical protein THTE_0567 [Thermogutta terrifontis]|uniref:Uncharacterized protein n=1 Tax=Thermogutta terrifontis TaxID=1331910 RepID=A0A286RB60_9BACT|nr:hypothetical protein THTE_0567 [Thermogutta terrifontis]